MPSTWSQSSNNSWAPWEKKDSKRSLFRKGELVDHMKKCKPIHLSCTTLLEEGKLDDRGRTLRNKVLSGHPIFHWCQRGREFWKGENISINDKGEDCWLKLSLMSICHCWKCTKNLTKPIIPNLPLMKPYEILNDQILKSPNDWKKFRI